MNNPTRLAFPLGMVTVADPIDIPDGACRYQQDFINSPVTAITTRPGFTKSNTTGLGTGIQLVAQLKTQTVDVKIAIDAAGQVHAL